jgi:hypothetical protein
MEARMTLVAQGQLSKLDFIKMTVEEMEVILRNLQQRK